MDKRILCAVGALILLPATAGAYVGPGAGLSLLGALWALLVALGTALVFVIAWPVRRMLRKKREEQADRGAERAEHDRDERDTRSADREEPLPSKRP
jgi:membrane protein implicated in regulation of membrane protease activity